MLRARSSATAVVSSFLLFLLLNSTLIESTCFNPDGSTSSDLPCDPNNDSVCCSEGFYCLSNGLCQDPRYTNPLRLQRGGCNDKGWGNCPSFCKSEYTTGDESVTYCGNGKYCCSSQDCCDNPDTTFLTLGDPSIYTTAMQGGDPNIKSTATIQQTQVFSAPLRASAASTPLASTQSSDSNPTSPASNPASTNSAASNPTGSIHTTPNPSTSSPTPILTTITLSGTIITTTISASSPSSTTPSSPSTSHHTNTPAIAAGASVGGAVVLALLALLVFLRRRSRKGRRRMASPVEIDSGGAREEFEGSGGFLAWIRGKQGGERREIGGVPVFEMSAETGAVEMGAGERKAEGGRGGLAEVEGGGVEDGDRGGGGEVGREAGDEAGRSSREEEWPVDRKTG